MWLLRGFVNHVGLWYCMFALEFNKTLVTPITSRLTISATVTETVTKTVAAESDDGLTKGFITENLTPTSLKRLEPTVWQDMDPPLCDWQNKDAPCSMPLHDLEEQKPIPILRGAAIPQRKAAESSAALPSMYWKRFDLLVNWWRYIVLTSAPKQDNSSNVKVVKEHEVRKKYAFPRPVLSWARPSDDIHGDRTQHGVETSERRTSRRNKQTDNAAPSSDLTFQLYRFFVVPSATFMDSRWQVQYSAKAPQKVLGQTSVQAEKDCHFSESKTHENVYFINSTSATVTLFPHYVRSHADELAQCGHIVSKGIDLDKDQERLLHSCKSTIDDALQWLTTSRRPGQGVTSNKTSAHFAPKRVASNIIWNSSYKKCMDDFCDDTANETESDPCRKYTPPKGMVDRCKICNERNTTWIEKHCHNRASGESVGLYILMGIAASIFLAIFIAVLHKKRIFGRLLRPFEKVRSKKSRGQDVEMATLGHYRGGKSSKTASSSSGLRSSGTSSSSSKGKNKGKGIAERIDDDGEDDLPAGNSSRPYGTMHTREGRYVSFRSLTDYPC